MLGSLLKSPTVWKFLLRHIAGAIGGYVEAKGIVSATGWEEVLGAVSVLGAFGHSFWDKREDIKQDIINSTSK